MKEIQLIKILNKFSLFFGIFNYILLCKLNITHNILLFFWFSIIVFISLNLKNNKNKLYKSLSLLILLPLIYFILFEKSVSNILLVLTMIAFSEIFIFKKNSKLLNSSIRDELNITLFIIVIIFVISLATKSYKSFERTLLPYFMLYIISSVFLERFSKIKHYTKSIRLINTLDFTLLIVLVFVLIMADIKKAFSLFISLLSASISKVLVVLLSHIPINLKIKHIKFAPLQDGFIDFYGNSSCKYGFVATIIMYILCAIIAILLFLLIFWAERTFMEIGKRKKITKKKYTEEIQYIKSQEDIININIINKFKKVIIPINNREKIRFYYTKFIKKCIKNNIIINPSNTTYEINEKCRNTFDTSILNKMRNIYLKVRYTDNNVDNKTTSDFIDGFKHLNKQ